MSGDPESSQLKTGWDAWYLIVRGDTPIGISHLEAKPGVDEEPTVDFETEQRLLRRLGNAGINERVQRSFSEDEKGGLREFSSRHQVGPQVAVTTVDFGPSRALLKTQRGLQSSSRSVGWDPATRGPLAVHQSLRSRPMRVGDSRRLTMMQPMHGGAVEVRLNCVGEAVVPRHDGSTEKLLEVAWLDLVDGEVVRESAVWVDDAGIVRRQLLPSLDAVAYLCTETQIDSLAAGMKESVPSAFVEVEGTNEELAGAEVALYEIAPSGFARQSDRPVDVISGPGQCVKQESEGRWQVLVNCAGSKRVAGFERYQSVASPADLNSSTILDYRSPAITEIQQKAGSGVDRTNLDMAEELALLTNQLTSPSPSPEGIVPASQVAREAKGDALGQAILLAALLRSKSIESRVVIGLRYVPASERDVRDKPLMQFHAWTAAWGGDRWYPLDATSGGAATADRIALKVLELENEGNAAEQLADVVGSLADLEIRVLRVR